MSVAFPAKTRGSSAGRPKGPSTAAVEKKKFDDKLQQIPEGEAKKPAPAEDKPEQVKKPEEAKKSEDAKEQEPKKQSPAAEAKEEEKPKKQSPAAEEKHGSPVAGAQADAAAISEKKDSPSVADLQPESELLMNSDRRWLIDLQRWNDFVKIKNRANSKPISSRFNPAIKEGDDDIEAEEDKKFEPLSWGEILDEPTTAFRTARKRKWRGMLGPYQSSFLYRNRTLETFIDTNGEGQAPEDEEGEPDAKRLKLSMSLPGTFFLDSEGCFRDELMMTFLASNGNLHHCLEVDTYEETFTALNLCNADVTEEQVGQLAWALGKGLPLTSLKLAFNSDTYATNYSLIESATKGRDGIHIFSI